MLTDNNRKVLIMANVKGITLRKYISNKTSKEKTLLQKLNIAIELLKKRTCR